MNTVDMLGVCNSDLVFVSKSQMEWTLHTQAILSSHVIMRADVYCEF